MPLPPTDRFYLEEKQSPVAGADIFNSDIKRSSNEKKHIVAMGVLAAMATVQAAEKPTQFDFTVGQANTVANSQHGSQLFADLKTGLAEGKVGVVYGAATSDHSNSFIAAISPQAEVTNEGTIWVVAVENGKYAAGMQNFYDFAGRLTNKGTIYVEGSTNNSAAKAMGADSATALLNQGKIFVNNGSAMYFTSDDPTASAKSMINDETGEIVVTNGWGMVYEKKADSKAVTFQNKGKVSAIGENSVGVVLMENSNLTATNSGTIEASEGATGIYVASTTTELVNEGSIVAGDGNAINAAQATDMTLTLKGASHVDGKVALADSATLKVETLASENEEIELVASALKGVNLKNSTIALGGGGALAVKTMTTEDDSILKLTDTRTIAIESVSGDQLTIESDHFADQGQTIAINENNLTGETSVEFTANAVDALSSEEVEAKLKEQQKSLGTKNSTLAGYGTNFTTTLDKNGNVTTTGSDITQSTMDMAAMTLVAWRNETTTLNDRMSTLRTSPAQFGAWVRWNGGEYKYDKRNLSNKFNTIEVGGDVDVGNNWIVGASLSYTKGEGDFQQGETDSDAYAGALYALWSHESGSFVDMVMKTGRISTDYDFYNLQGGAVDAAKIKQTGFIMGVETGHRFNLTDMFYVEPQVQLTYSRLSGVNETTEQRTLNLEASDSLIGRVGLMAGINCPNDKGSAYVRVSGLRDFRGDIDGTFSANGHDFTVKHELDDNWFEFAIGGSVKFADNFYGFADVQKSTGGDIDLDWRANVGVRAYF